jgi:hypothetical protein
VALSFFLDKKRDKKSRLVYEVVENQAPPRITETHSLQSLKQSVTLSYPRALVFYQFHPTPGGRVREPEWG